MAYSIAPSKQYDRDIKHLKKKHLETFKQLMSKIERISTNPYHTGHPLRSKYKGLWETHIQNNILVYRIKEETKVVELVSYIDHDIL
jgi:YafQ family addiction module toxin component